jgi:hypothetical protein
MHTVESAERQGHCPRDSSAERNCIALDLLFQSMEKNADEFLPSDRFNTIDEAIRTEWELEYVVNKHHP